MRSSLAASVVSVLLLFVSVAEADVALSQDSLSHTTQSLFLTVGDTSPWTESVHFTSARRSLLQFQLDQCLWNSNAASCEIGNVALESLALMGESSYAEFLRRFYNCIRKGQTEDACNALSDCGWLQDGLCTLVNFVDAYPKSPCVKKSPLSFLQRVLNRDCPQRNSTEACSELKGCTWNEQTKTCLSDGYSIFVGIEQFEAKRNEVDQFKTSAILASILSNETFVAMDSYWNAFLDGYQIPKTECPKGYDQLVCDYVDAFLPLILPNYFYCRTKFTEASTNPKDCNADPLCAYRSESGECAQPLNVTFAAFEEAHKQVLLPVIPEATDRELFINSLKCSWTLTASECTGNCQWLPSFGLCRLRPLQAVQFVLSGVEEPYQDPVCSYYQTVYDHQCVDYYTSLTCSANNCLWFPKSNICASIYSAAAKTLIRQDPMLKKPYKRLRKSCSMYETAKECSCAETGSE